MTSHDHLTAVHVFALASLLKVEPRELVKEVSRQMRSCEYVSKCIEAKQKDQLAFMEGQL